MGGKCRKENTRDRLVILALMTATCDRRIEVSESETAGRTRAKRKISGEKKNSWRNARGDEATRSKKNAMKKTDDNQEGGVYERGVTYVRPEHDAVIIVNRPR